MFWNTEFLDTNPSNIDVLLQLKTVELVDILFEEDLLQELKTCNANLLNFLTKPDVVLELVENITKLTEKDCALKEVFSRVHSAYLSCEIITNGPEVFNAMMEHPECLDKILTCLIDKDQANKTTTTNDTQKLASSTLDIEQQQISPPVQSSTLEQQPSDNTELPSNPDNNIPQPSIEQQMESDDNPISEQPSKQESEESIPTEQLKSDNPSPSDHYSEVESNPQLDDNESEDKHTSTLDQLETEIPIETDQQKPQISSSGAECKADQNDTSMIDESISTNATTILTASAAIASTDSEVEKLSPEKVTLISKLISAIQSSSPDKLTCHITKDLATFSRLIDTLIDNIDMSSSFEILSTFISKTAPPDMRFVFCEILSKLNFVFKLIDVMTLSKSEDKQRNACQLLCDIIVIGRSENADGGFVCDRSDFDMLSQTMQSKEAVEAILNKIFVTSPASTSELASSEVLIQPSSSTTSIVCGLKVLQTLIEKLAMLSYESIVENINLIEDELDEYLIKLHDILKNPPKQEPIKTTFGIIERPLGYLRFEIVNFTKALIGTKSHKLMTRLVELNVIQVIIDLFFEFSWNNLIHTQVEQALKLFMELCEDKTIIDKLLKESDLIARLLGHALKYDATPETIHTSASSETLSGHSNKTDNQNIGHIYEILRNIKYHEDIPPIRNYIDDLKECKQKLWEKWDKIPKEERKRVTEVEDAVTSWMQVNHENNISDITDISSEIVAAPEQPETNITNNTNTNNEPVDSNLTNHNENINTNKDTILTNNINENDSSVASAVNPEADAVTTTTPSLPITTPTNVNLNANDTINNEPQNLNNNNVENGSYDLFTRDFVFPRINKDVIPRIRKPKDN